MGKLYEAMKKRDQDIKDHINSQHKSYVEDPAEGYAFTLRLNELNYYRNAATSVMSEAISQMDLENQKSFFQQIFSEKSVSDLAQKQFFRSELNTMANNAQLPAGRTKWEEGEKESYQRKTTLDFLAKTEEIGCTKEELCGRIEKALSASDLNKVKAKLGNNPSAEDRTFELVRTCAKKSTTEFAKCMTQEMMDKSFGRFLKSSLSKPDSSLLTNEPYYKKGTTLLDHAKVLESILGQEKADQLAERIESLEAPSQSKSRLWKPFTQTINSLREQNPTQTPEQKELLDKADDILTYASESYLVHMDDLSSDIVNQLGMDHNADAYGFVTTEKAIKEQWGQEMADKLPHITSSTGFQKYAFFDVRPPLKQSIQGEDVTLTPEELNKLRSAKAAPINKEARQAVLDVLSGMEEMGEKKYWLKGVVELKEGTETDPKKVSFLPEQGKKYYAFWPVYTAKEQVAAAVQKGDLKALQDSTAEYERCKTICDKMMVDANRSNKVPIFPANANSTRPDLEGGLIHMPTEYLEDYAGHSRVNGTFLLYGLTKNTGIEAEKWLDDPVDAFQKTGQSFLNTKMPSAKKDRPMSERLIQLFDADQQEKAFRDWLNTTNLFGKAMDAVNGYLPTEEERIQRTGLVYGAGAATNYDVYQELNPWKTLSECEPDKKQAVTQIALLLPEKSFDPTSISQKLNAEDWTSQLNTVDLIDHLKQNKQLDTNALVERTKTFLSEVGQALSDPVPGQDLVFYQKAALRNYRQIMNVTPEADRTSPAFQRLAEHAVELQNAVVKDAMEQGKDPDSSLTTHKDAVLTQINTLVQDKTGLFVSKTNSKEHQAMVQQLKLFTLKLDMLSGKEITQQNSGLNQETLEKLQKADPAILLINAKNACFKYACEKSKMGTDSFRTNAGVKRFEAACQCILSLGTLGQDLGLEPRAKSYADNARAEMLYNRSNKDWAKDNAANYAVKVLYATTLQARGIPEEEQENLLSKESMDRTIENMKNNVHFQKMLKQEGGLGLADRIIEGNAKLTAAYLRAQNGPKVEAKKQTGIELISQLQASEVTPEKLRKKSNRTL